MEQQKLIADRPLAKMEVYRLQLHLREVARYYLDYIAEIYSYALPTIVAYPDGRIETTYQQEVKEHVAEIEAHMREAVEAAQRDWMKMRTKG